MADELLTLPLGFPPDTQVSDELVLEQQQAEDRGEATAEHGPKNIKRRVYDV